MKRTPMGLVVSERDYSAEVVKLLAEVRRLRTENEQIQKWAQASLDCADERIAKLRLGLKQIASCKVVSADPPDCPQIARNLLAGREWNNCADGAKGEGR